MGKTIEFDAADFLDSEEMITEYLNQALASGDTDLLLAAIGDVAKARGMALVSRDSGLGRESLYKALTARAKPGSIPCSKCFKPWGCACRPNR